MRVRNNRNLPPTRKCLLRRARLPKANLPQGFCQLGWQPSRNQQVMHASFALIAIFHVVAANELVSVHRVKCQRVHEWSAVIII